MVKLANDLLPTIIVAIVVLLIAAFVICNARQDQHEIIEKVKQAQQEQQQTLDELIRREMANPEKWHKSIDQVKAHSPQP